MARTKPGYAYKDAHKSQGWISSRPSVPPCERPLFERSHPSPPDADFSCADGTSSPPICKVTLNLVRSYTVTPLPGYETIGSDGRTRVCRVVKPVYGMAQASR
eukprot:18540-Pleurochrysis_carterae.AAC.1